MGNLTVGGVNHNSSGANYLASVLVNGMLYEGEYLEGLGYTADMVGLFMLSGSQLVEVSWPGYQRQQIVGFNVDTNQTPPVLSNASALSWTGQSGWGTVAGIGLIAVDRTTWQKPAFVFAVTPISPVTMGPGVTLTIQSGQLQFYFD